MTVFLYIVSGLFIIYLLGVVVTFFISLNNYNKNLKKVEAMKEHQEFIEKIKKEGKWNKIFRPVWYSWLSFIVWLKYKHKIDIDQ